MTVPFMPPSSSTGNKDFNGKISNLCFEWQSTRLFPKGRGAHQVEVTGIAARCDWVITSDSLQPEVELRRLNQTDHPRTVFLSLRNPFVAISFFRDHVLPLISCPFVLVSGSEDITLPLQCDYRWRAFNSVEDQCIYDIASHSCLVHWFVENLDWSFVDCMSPLPLGVLPLPMEELVLIPPDDTPLPLAERDLIVLCANRIREGPQWQARRRLRDHLVSLKYDWILLPDHECAPSYFSQLLNICSFVICASGGGHDPCPKLWHTLIHGSIPIVQKSALTVYLAKALPMWIVNNWQDVDWSLESLSSKKAEIQQHYPPHSQLKQLLSLDFWWDRIVAHL